MDFIEQLPNSSRYTAILVVVDWLSKQCIFIPTNDKVTSLELAKLFLLHVFSKHGVSSHITSDQGSEFISHFFRSLGKALDIHLHFTSRYHLEGDGQTEWMNQTLEQYLQIYCNYQQDNWSELLPLVEFSYNNALNATTGVSPFFTNKGYHPNISIHPEWDLTSKRAREYSIDLDSLHQFLQEEMMHAQERYQGCGMRIMIWPYSQITRRVVCHLPATSTTSLITTPNSIHVLLCYLNSSANNNSTLIIMLANLSSIKSNTSLDLNDPALPRTQSHHSTTMRWSLFSATHACIYTMRRSQRRTIMAFSHSTSWRKTVQVWSLLKEPVFVLQQISST